MLTVPSLFLVMMCSRGRRLWHVWNAAENTFDATPHIRNVHDV
jgi:hypothetical protein